jgi:hypothetical protein
LQDDSLDKLSNFLLEGKIDTLMSEYADLIGQRDTAESDAANYGNQLGSINTEKNASKHSQIKGNQVSAEAAAGNLDIDAQQKLSQANSLKAQL